MNKADWTKFEQKVSWVPFVMVQTDGVNGVASR